MCWHKCPRLPNWWQVNCEPIPVGKWAAAGMAAVIVAVLGMMVWVSGEPGIPQWVIYVAWPLILVSCFLVFGAVVYGYGYDHGKQKQEATKMLERTTNDLAAVVEEEPHAA